ncbi:MAG: hypothetical protein NTZ73_01025 [Candidatus Diapherotrites archaeon]|nr:hypothetical protein [Candidatus Diapherotrites archaeon]
MRFGAIKFVLAVLAANAVRLLRFIPNNDPIMAMMLPVSKKRNFVAAFLFPFLTMVSFDIITGYVGIWTVVTSLTYGGLGLLFAFIYGKEKKVGLKKYFFSGVAGVLIFDFITGVLATPLMFGMSFEQALLGQIPFTLMHLFTVSIYIFTITPLIDRYVVESKVLQDDKVADFVRGLFYNFS